MAFFACVLFTIDWRLALVAMAVVPLLAVAAVVFRYKVREAYREVRVWIARINAHLQETITGMKVVQLFARERRNLADFAQHQRLPPRRLVHVDPLRLAAVGVGRARRGNVIVALHPLVRRAPAPGGSSSWAR